MNKTDLRKYIFEKRRLLDINEVNIASEVIVGSIKELAAIKFAKLVFSYMPYGKEVDIKPLNQWVLDQGKKLCIPRVINKTEMEPRIVRNINQGLLKNSFGILEPAISHELADYYEIDLILVPGLAFDKSGNRIGHGNGYYDRFLSRCPKSTLFIGVAFSFQVFDSIPFDKHDVKLHSLITEKYTLDFIRN
ncbi:MAG: 5-formyltetrahydrofolate cyclo-ligase [Acetivibrionales bacterium]